MRITWYGHSCFRLYEPGMASVVTDPFDHTVAGYHPLHLKADIVTVSHNSAGHNYLQAVKGNPFVINGPGEYEIGDVFVTGIDSGGEKRTAGRQNTLYVFHFHHLILAHLGNLDRIPSQAEIEEIGPVHIVMIPIGGGSCLNASRAVEVISLLEPNIVVPMHYATSACKLELDPIQKFLKEMGITEIETQSALEITTNIAQLPTETQVVVLDYLQND